MILKELMSQAHHLSEFKSQINHFNYPLTIGSQHHYSFQNQLPNKLS